MFMFLLYFSCAHLLDVFFAEALFFLLPVELLCQICLALYVCVSVCFGLCERQCAVLKLTNFSTTN
jgi:hypothetical protein